MESLNRAYEEMGRVNEIKYKPIIQSIYGNVKKANFKYSRIDFYGETYILELKSRNMASTDYKDTMIGYNKIKEGFKQLELRGHPAYPESNDGEVCKFKVFFAFGFTDGLFVWELNKENYEANGGDSKKRMGGTSNRGWDDYKEHYYIDNSRLTKISDIGCFVPDLVRENTNKLKTSLPVGVCLIKLKNKK